MSGHLGSLDMASKGSMSAARKARSVNRGDLRVGMLMSVNFPSF